MSAGEPTISTHIHTTWPSVVEALGHTGLYDYVEFVAECGPSDLHDLDNLCRAAELHNRPGSYLQSAPSLARSRIASSVLDHRTEPRSPPRPSRHPRTIPSARSRFWSRFEEQKWMHSAFRRRNGHSVRGVLSRWGSPPSCISLLRAHSRERRAWHRGRRRRRACETCRASAAFGDRRSGDVVVPTLDAEQYPVVTRETNSRSDVVGRGREGRAQGLWLPWRSRPGWHRPIPCRPRVVTDP